MSKSINKTDLKGLKELAAMLPETKEEYWQTIDTFGSDILAMKIDTEGTEIKPDEVYSYKKQFFRTVNHLTKIKKIFKREGIEGVYTYVNGLVELFSPKKIDGVESE